MNKQLAIKDIHATILETSLDRVGSMVTKRLDSSVFERNVLVLHAPINVSIAHRKTMHTCANGLSSEFVVVLFSLYRAFWTLFRFHLFTEMFNMIIYFFASPRMSVLPVRLLFDFLRKCVFNCHGRGSSTVKSKLNGTLLKTIHIS